MRPTTPSRKFGLVEPIGIGTGLVEASSSLWKRAAERTSVKFGDFVRWAFDEQTTPFDHPFGMTGRMAIDRRMMGIDGMTAVAKVYLEPLRNIVASDHIEACTLLPFAGHFSGFRLLRRCHAWCPLCLRLMYMGLGVYEPLLWRLSDVTACPFHNVELVTTCHACKEFCRDIIGRFARVGCCNRCGVWLGADDAVLKYLDADDPAVKISCVIAGLLERTTSFNNPGYDGRLTFRKLVPSKEMRDLLALSLDVPPQTITAFARTPSFPRLEVLAAVASASRQPLNQVILGQITPWTVTSASIINISIIRRGNCKLVEQEFESLAESPDVTDVGEACKRVGISRYSAIYHFPKLVKKIVQRGKSLRAEKFAAIKQVRMECVRNAFRASIASGVYPSSHRLQQITGINMRPNWPAFRRLIDEEWARARGSCIQRTKAGSRRLGN